ncbi:germ cell nuclear acidic protein [Halichoeres trimaculatus]|uniref:germ cell nuclear acidic protein n=1 Tax=Halichoeres trimaculatus TaxID=147232 RepID=UPI003D9DD384
MNDENRKLFERVSKKLGWVKDGDLDLDTAEKKLMSAIGKSRHAATSGHQPVDPSGSPGQFALSDSDADSDKENQRCMGNNYRTKSLIESSDDEEFEQFLVGLETPKTKKSIQKPLSTAKKESSNIHVVSSDDDGSFETFLQRVKTPKAKPKESSESASEDSMKNFIVDDVLSDDDFIEPKLSFKVPKKNTPAPQHLPRRPVIQCDSPVFVSDSDEDDDNIVIKSTWRTRHSKPKPPQKAKRNDTVLCEDEDSSPSLPLPSNPSPLTFPPHRTPTALASSKRTLSAPSKLEGSESSEDEFTSLLERLKRKNKLIGTSCSPRNSNESRKEPPVLDPPAKGFKIPAPKTSVESPLQMKTPVKHPVFKPTISQTEPRPGPTSRVALCKTPGCFLESLSNPGANYGRNFKQNKEELTSKLFLLYNTSVFDSKLPANMSVTWNKKMRKTAGYCITGQERGGGNRYARIELSEKVCDSADRLRDTLVHEMCHAATWLINGVRDGHGSFWKLYARKATVAHPELPMVTRCHSYDIKYKYQYQCTRCKNTIGRHSKSLDTQRFVCALCTGQLVLLTPSKPRAPTPFANFVKENYGTVRQELAGQSHAEVMRKLSADFASKTKLSQS